ncbi:MAG: hypothetical protein RIR28_325 [Pseudomonadota bacterium]
MNPADSARPVPRGGLLPSPWGPIHAVLVVLMVIYGVAWEAAWDPIREGSLLWLKTLPLLLVLPGLIQSRRRSMQWLSLMIWFYACEALVRVASLQPTEQWLAAGWLVLSLLVAAANWLSAKAYRRQMAIGDSPSEMARRQ